MPNSNTADDAAVYELDLKAGDIVVMATDGVFDNLFTSDLEDIIGAFMTVIPSTRTPPSFETSIPCLWGL